MNHLAKVIIIGAGKGGTALLELFHEDPSIEVLGMVDRDTKALGMLRAQEMGYPAARDLSVFLYDPQFDPNMIVNASGSQEIWEELEKIDDPSIRVIGGVAAKFIWALLEARQEKKFLEKKYQQLKSSINLSGGNQLIFGSNPIMKQVDQMIKQVAPTDSTVLIVGETGTGKEVIAQALQSLSAYRDQAFLKINCTAFSPQLLESELFGYKKGAFTGAVQDKIGLLEAADGGTIFLDEIGDISLEMQVKLLRYLQFGEVRPVGSTETKIVKTRIIAATNRNLEEQIQEKTFREDLFYRLNTFTIELPPLRQRKEDIPLLTHHFLKKAVIKLNKKVSGIESYAVELLSAYHFPGNLRELQSVIERAVIMCESDMIMAIHLPAFVQNVKTPFQLRDGLIQSREKMVANFERKALLQYLAEANGNVSQAAMKAKISRKTFYRLMEKYSISKESLPSQLLDKQEK
ncbi:MAG: sigma 54-interacting transcriptional regulator [Bacteroidia bacterium]|nr:sigma 54-interacting transcriptional regulator [Bacteroidia bacterium]